MGRRERTQGGRAARLAELLASGDHRGAGEAARALLADEAATEAERAAARAALKGLRPEPGAVAACAVGLVLALATTAWTLWHP